MPRSFRAFAAVLAVVLSATGLAACGGGDDDSSQSPQQLLQDTFGANKPVKSGNLGLNLDVVANGLQGVKGPVSIKLNGPFESQGKGKLPEFDLTLTLQTGATNFTAGAVSTGEKGFLKVQGKTYEVGDQLFNQFKQGYEKAASQSQTRSGGLSLKSLGVDPLAWLTDPKNAGTEDVGGTETYHITAGVNISRFLEDVNSLLGKASSLGQGNLPSGLTAQQRTAIERSVKSAKLDVWTGKDDKTLRRVRIELGISVPADLRKQANGLKNGVLVFDLKIEDLNESQDIKEPEGARPLSELTSALGGALPGTSGGGTATTPPATTPPATTAPPAGAGGASQEYLDCLAKAKNDISKVQKCADLLGG
jgi:hypothetical protein